MRARISLKWSLPIIIIVIVVFSTIILLLLNDKLGLQKLSDTNIIVPVQNIIIPDQIISELPTRLRIPSKNIDAAIEYVGLTSGGAMEVPKGPSSVAWFNLGPRPGDKGSAVIAGHSGWKNGIPAVFDDLHKLQKGDKIYVEDKNGLITSFVVRESRLYDPDADATDVFRSYDGKAHLNLITCEGVWDTVTKSRSKRLVVFTDKE